ncbi:hypothetical protein [Streptomyces sp. NPDC048825]|uniref:hypothetical protein n=1 Tax=Streptomyces sp. NPDC048825 TaxID=3365592 RepID=UPI0037174FEF
MHIRTAAVTVLLALTTLTGCSSDGKADPAACKAALEKQYEDSATGKEADDRPPACNGVDNATLQKYAAEIIKEQIDEGLEGALGGVTAQP